MHLIEKATEEREEEYRAIEDLLYLQKDQMQ